MAKQNIEKITEWQKKNTDRIVIRVQKSRHLPERIQQAIDNGCGDSRQAYIIDAIIEKLERDGIPEIENEDAQEDDE